MTAVADLLALLEDGPHAVAELAGWLRQPEPLVRYELRRLRELGQVRRAGTKWMLAPPSVESVADPEPPPAGTQRADVLAAVKAGADTSYAVAERTGLSVKSASGVLSSLRAQGLIVPIGEVKYPGAPIAVIRYRATARTPSPRATPKSPMISTGENLRDSSRTAASSRPVLDGRIRVIDGERFESIWNGRDPLPGSGAADGLGMTLAGASFGVQVGRRHVVTR